MLSIDWKQQIPISVFGLTRPGIKPNNIIISDICSYSFPYFSSTVFKGRYYISGVMASIFSLSVVDRGFDSKHFVECLIINKYLSFWLSI
jgi:thiamine transporter ThiT